MRAWRKTGSRLNYSGSIANDTSSKCFSIEFELESLSWLVLL